MFQALVRTENPPSRQSKVVMSMLAIVGVLISGVVLTTPKAAWGQPVAGPGNPDVGSPADSPTTCPVGQQPQGGLCEEPGNPDEFLDAPDATYCPDDRIWFGGTCRKRRYFRDQLGIPAGVTIEMLGISPGYYLTASGAPTDETFADFRPGAALRVVSPTERHLISIDDTSNGPVVEQTEEYTSQVINGWWVETTAHFDLDGVPEPIEVPPGVFADAEYTFPQSRWMAADVKPTWWEMKGQRGSEFFVLGTDHPVFGVAIADSAQCTAEGQSSYNDSYEDCINGAWLAFRAARFAGAWNSGSLASVAGLNTFGVVVAVLGPTKLKAALGTGVTAGGAAATAVYTAVNSIWESAINDLESSHEDYCERHAEEARLYAIAHCEEDRSGTSSSPPFRQVQPPRTSGDQECPDGTQYFPPHFIVEYCLPATEVVVDTGSETTTSTQPMQCFSVQMPASGGCVKI